MQYDLRASAPPREPTSQRADDAPFRFLGIDSTWSSAHTHLRRKPRRDPP